MPDGQPAGHTKDKSVHESDDPVPGSIKTPALSFSNVLDPKKFGKTTMDGNGDKSNGLTDGSHLRRRRRSSGDSDLVVLSVVFNKKKQKQNDEVAIAIERLRENGVNCVLFTMNDFRNGNTKPESVIPDSFRLSSSPSSTNSCCPLSREREQTKFLTSLPMIPSIKCEVMENSNGSSDSNSSDSLAIHQSVEKVINSFSPSPSPSPPPLSPQLVLTSTSDSEFKSKPVMKPSLHELLSPLLAEKHPPPLHNEVPTTTVSEQKLQEIQICSSSSPGEFNPNSKRRRRRVRKPYTHRKAQLKKKLKIIAEEAKATRAAQRAAKVRAATGVSSSEKSFDHDPNSFDQEQISSSNDRLKRQEEPVDSSLNARRQSKDNECFSRILSTDSKEIQNDHVNQSNDTTSPTDAISGQSEVIIPDSSSNIPASTKSSKGSSKKRKRSNGRRNKKRNGLKSRGIVKLPMLTVEDTSPPTTFSVNGTVPTASEIKVSDLPERASDLQQDSTLLVELMETDTIVNDDDSTPLSALLKRKRAFSPDIIRGIRQNNSQKIGNMDVQYLNNVDCLEASRASFIALSQKEVTNEQAKIEITSCVQNAKISKANQVQPIDNYDRPDNLAKVVKEQTKKKKKRGGKLRLVVRKNMRLKKANLKSVHQSNGIISEATAQLDCKPEAHSLPLDILQGKNSYAISGGIQGFKPKAGESLNGASEESLYSSKKSPSSSGEIFHIKEETCLGQDDDSVPSVDSGLPSSENASVSDDFKVENGSDSSGGSSVDSQSKQSNKSTDSSGVYDSTASQDLLCPQQGPGSFRRSEDSLPASPDGMQLRRSNFYFLISDNVRKNMENYLDGRMVTKVQTKRRKRTKNSYLLNHGDNYPDDPEAPYKLHMATQVLLKLNKRRAKCKPKEDRGKSLLSYLKLVPKRPPRTGKAALPSPKEEVPKESHEEPLFSGEWSIPRQYICHVCGQIESTFWDMVMHKGELHPGVLVTHTELTGQVPQSLVRTVASDHMKEEVDIPSCSKCKATFSTTADLHRHIFECAGNAVWLEEEKTPRKRKSKRRRGFKRRLSNTPKKAKKSELPKRRPAEVFKCEFCPREFKTEGWLKNHLVTHSLPVSIPLEKLSLPSRASNNSTSSRLFKT